MPTISKKKVTLIFYLSTLALAVLLAMVIPQTTFNPGVPLPQVTQSVGTDQTSQHIILADEVNVNLYIKAFFSLLFIVTLLVAGYSIIKKIPWKKILRTYLLTFSALLGLLALIGVIVSLLNPKPPEPTAYEPQKLVFTPVIRVTPVNKIPVQGPDINLLIGIGLGIIGLVIAAFVIYWLVGRKKGSEIDPLEIEAKLAIQAIRTGSDLKSVIIRCYKQMSQALQAEQGLDFEEDMTAREFERLLEERGIPNLPVVQLTRLFESARYSIRPPTAQDEKNAIESLNAIIQYSKKKSS
jgi:hypothetical protein